MPNRVFLDAAYAKVNKFGGVFDFATQFDTDIDKPAGGTAKIGFNYTNGGGDRVEVEITSAPPLGGFRVGVLTSTFEFGGPTVVSVNQTR